MATRFLDAVELHDAGDPASGELPAGDFGRWLDDTCRALAAPVGVDVPCGTCTACCRSAYFIHIGADETDTLARIPRDLLVPAPGRPGERVLGFDERGHCPMLVDGACSIYEHRPLTCRRFDCRVFAAAGVDPRPDGKAELADRARRWRFDHAGEGDRRKHAALRTAARLIDERRRQLGRSAPANRTQLAVRAIACHRAVLDLADRAERSGRPPSEASILEAIRPVDDGP